MFLALVVLLSAGGAVAALASPQAQGSRVTFAPRWQVVSHKGFATNGLYTLLTGSRPGEAGTMIDEGTGQRVTVLLPPRCHRPIDTPLLGDSWLLADCRASRLDLYSLAAHQWRPVTVATTCQRFPRGAGSRCVPVAVGTDWIEYDEESVHLGDVFIFQSLTTDAVRRDPTNARTLPNLDSPSLAQRVCTPLRVPSAGTLAFDGRFAVATERGGIFLEQCDTRLHLAISDTPWVAMAPGAIVWLPAPNRALRGIFLPSLRTFTVAPPRGADMADAGISDRHIYIIGQAANNRTDVWSAPAPVLEHPKAP